MKAGFARVRITPPVGSTMYGFAVRDRDHGCEGTHDDLFVRALYLSHEGREALIVGLDLLFLGRKEVDRCKGAIGRELDLLPKQILLNTSHTHCGPMVGTTWAYARWDREEANRSYRDELERAVVRAASRARRTAREAILRAGSGRSSLPRSRRRPDGKGGVLWAPHPDGEVCRHLPVCLLEDRSGQAICLLFSVSCHPSTTGGFEISADYPGIATDLLDRHLGVSCSLFLQGTGGDAKARVVGKGERWRTGTWEDVLEAGRIVADEVVQVLDTGLSRIDPGICCVLTEMEWPLQPAPDRARCETIVSDGEAGELERLWAKRQIEHLDCGLSPAGSARVLLHGIRLGRGLRLVALEGEAVAGIGLHVLDFYGDGGTTFPLGYSDGMEMYLPTSRMVDEGGYEVDSFREYGQPAPLAKGMEAILTQGLGRLRAGGVD